MWVEIQDVLLRLRKVFKGSAQVLENFKMDRDIKGFSKTKNLFEVSNYR